MTTKTNTQKKSRNEDNSPLLAFLQLRGKSFSIPCGSPPTPSPTDHLNTSELLWPQAKYYQVYILHQH